MRNFMRVQDSTAVLAIFRRAEMQTNIPTFNHPCTQVVSIPRALLGALVVVFLSCVLAPLSHAQYRASLRGVLSDATGAIIPGATVTLVNTETGEKKVSTSDANGLYDFEALPPGRFSLTVERDGF